MEIVSDYLSYWSDRKPDSSVFYYHEGEISWREFEDKTQRLAAYLIKKGARLGDAIAYRLPGCPDFYFLYMAASLLGLVCVGVHMKSPPEAAAQIINAANAVLYFDGAVPPEAYEEPPYTGEAKAAGDSPLFMLFTSGTTGTPKPVLLTHSNLIAAAKLQAASFCDGCTHEDVYQLQVPVSHVSGAAEWGAAPVICGCSIVLNDCFEAHTVLENTQKYRVTMLCGVPAMWSMMLRCGLERYDLSSVRWCMSGASPAPRKLLERIIRFRPAVSNPLGLTETSGFCAFSPKGATLDELYHTVGRPAIDCKLIDGQLAWRGGTLSPSCALNSEGYFLSGDLAELDSGGGIHLLGRADDAFFTGGYTVYPYEIENEIMQYPGIALALVVPVANSLHGAVGKACIVPENGAEIDCAKLRDFLADRLAPYKLPRSYEQRDSLPMTALGKLKRKHTTEG